MPYAFGRVQRSIAQSCITWRIVIKRNRFLMAEMDGCTEAEAGAETGMAANLLQTLLLL